MVVNDTSIQSVKCIKIRGVLIDDRLNFSENVSKIVSQCNSRIFLLHHHKILGMGTTGLNTFYSSNVRSIISYTSPAWYCLLSQRDKDRLEKLQRSATKVILPEQDYNSRLAILNLTTIDDFICGISERLFNRIVNNPTHPLYERLCFNKGRMSARNNTVFKPKRARTQKRANSFFYYNLTK